MYANKTTTTLWTETLLEVLYSGLKNQEDEPTIKAAVSDLRAMGFPSTYLVQMVAQEVGSAAAQRLEGILGGRPLKAAASARARTAGEGREQQTPGFFTAVLNRLGLGGESRTSRRSIASRNRSH